ncbi:MAG: hypothetical protein MJ092_03550 [Lachnospiraceae bacterium]|nr:hypothetical protein [Lachnospiraceae bacterium]
MIKTITGKLKNIFSFGLNKILRDDDGVGVVEVILILLVLVGLVIIFKDQIVALAKTIFQNINSQVNSI